MNDRPAQVTETEPVKPGHRRQVGALCLDAGGRVLLITSRDTGRWVIPKGWTMPGRTLAEAALCEAWEEAGVEGRIGNLPIGRYRYDKILRNGKARPVVVQVFLAAVDGLAGDWPEAGQRIRRWFAPGEAATLVAEPELRQLLHILPEPATRPTAEPAPVPEGA